MILLRHMRTVSCRETVASMRTRLSILLFVLMIVSTEIPKSILAKKKDNALWETVHYYNQSSQCNTSYWPNFYCSYNTDDSCFSILETCDGHRDCANAEDECHSMCSETFQCEATMECIAMDEFCDGVANCRDKSDEIDPSVNSDGFTCSNAWRKIKADAFGGDWREKRVPWNPEARSQWEESESRKCLLPRHHVCDGVNHCGDHSDECSPEANCSVASKFYCQNKKCISRNNVCDGRDDCGDGSDERNENCSRIFPCKNGRLIPMNQFCDGVQDCTDGSDEIIESHVSDTDEYFRGSVLCSNIVNHNSKRCLLPPKYNCDGDEHCYDREDECTQGCQHSFHCPNGKCFVHTRRCDGVGDCDDMSDECDPTQCHSIFTCDNGTCLSLDRFCDGRRDCPNGEDEIDDQSRRSDGDVFCSSRTAARSKDTGRVCRLPERFVCDGWDQCGDRTDECSLDCPLSFFCDGNSTCISRKRVDDDTLDCKDESDEPGLGLDTHYQRGFKCRIAHHGKTKQHVLPQQHVDDVIADCIDKIDVCSNGGNDSNRYSVMEKCVRCLTEDVIISKRQICDGVIDCRDLSDECLCESNRISNVCRLRCGEGSGSVDHLPCSRDGPQSERSQNEQGARESNRDACVPSEYICNGRSECAGGVDEKHCFFGEKEEEKEKQQMLCRHFQEGNWWAPRSATPCDNKPECFFMEDECESGCASLPSYCFQRDTKGSFSCPDHRILPALLVCNGRSDCQTTEGFHDEYNCTDRFYCSNGSDPISIDRSKVCDFIDDCQTGADESNCPDTHFYCLNKKFPFYLRLQSVMDGKEDCSDGSDECPQEYFQNSVFSSHHFLIKEPILQFMVWVMGTVAIVGNMCVIVYTATLLNNTTRNKLRNIAVMNSLLIVNLAIADLLMGIFLISLAVKNSLTSGEYCRFDRGWRSSLTCQVLGVVATLSAEVSLTTLSILASYRLYCVLRPIKSRGVRVKKAILHICATWLLGIVLALVPLFSTCKNYFVTDLWIQHSPYFTRDLIPRKDLVNFCQTYLSYNASWYNGSACTSSTQHECFEWDDLIKCVEMSHLPHKINGTLGYYSIHATCLPKLFLLPGEASWEFSLGVSIFNFLECLYIIAIYLILWLERKVSDVGKSSQSTKILQKRVALLVASNCACWLPICTVAFIHHSGVAMSKSSYAFAAIILFPINSALNPIFYSNVLQQLWAKIVGFFRRFELIDKLGSDARSVCSGICMRKSQAPQLGTETNLLPQSPQSMDRFRAVTELTVAYDYSSMPESNV